MLIAPCASFCLASVLKDQYSGFTVGVGNVGPGPVAVFMKYRSSVGFMYRLFWAVLSSRPDKAESRSLLYLGIEWFAGVVEGP